ncbi:MAG: capsule assembly Wzi family protein [Spirosomataceae bacterium]
MLQRISGVFVCIFMVCSVVQAQTTHTDFQENIEHTVQRLEVLSGSFSDVFHSSQKPYSRQYVVQLAEEVENNYPVRLQEVDLKNNRFIREQYWNYLPDSKQWESYSKTYLGRRIYKRKGDFVSYEGDDYSIQASPIFHFGVGTEQSLEGESATQFINTRGAEIKGTLNKKLSFYSRFTENQQTNLTFVRTFMQQTNGTPYLGFVKFFGEGRVPGGIDFIDARGVLMFKPFKNTIFLFGHDKNFVGAGYRSMILSDFSAPYLQLKTTINIGKLQYTSIFAQLANLQARNTTLFNQLIPPKYMTFHRISANVRRNLQVGIFEKVVFGQRPIGFDLNYLNPVIFYRFVEGFLGSPDNVIVGSDLKWILGKKAVLYGQFALDELKLSEFQADGWWAKKFAYQVGARYFDLLGISNLDFLVEYNRARPYMYSHFSTFSNAVHYNLPLAHPLGANFGEFIAQVKYQPWHKLTFEGIYMRYKKGLDEGVANFGGDILKSNDSFRVRDFGNFVGQGLETHVQFLRGRASYMLKNNLFLDLEIGHRTQFTPVNAQKSTDLYFNSGVRLNIMPRNYLF